MSKILVTGACGQLGVEIINGLETQYGRGNVIASDINEPGDGLTGVPFEFVDVMNPQQILGIVKKHKITIICHLAALLSATAEKNIDLARKLNIGSLHSILTIAKDEKLEKVFWPSSIAVFGPDAKTDGTPQNSACTPSTVYGISKVSGELWCAYYYNTFGVDVRSVRYPGLIGYKSLPGGGTTDYAVDIYHKAVKGETFECFLKPDTRLPMMFMDDAVKATLDLMNANPDGLTVRTSYNIAAISFTPEEIAASIRKRYPNFEIVYKPDYRQQIADSWPDRIDDTVARTDWNWNPNYDLDTMTNHILDNLSDFWKY